MVVIKTAGPVVGAAKGGTGYEGSLRIRHSNGTLQDLNGLLLLGIGRVNIEPPGISGFGQIAAVGQSRGCGRRVVSLTS